MSTRSGKRIHGLIHEDDVDNLAESKSIRKTRNKQDKENTEVLLTSKKRKNYVRYPSEEDVANNLNGNLENTAKSTLKSKRNTLKEQNLLTADTESSNDDRRLVRVTRRTKKFDIINDSEGASPNIEDNESKGKKKGNKNKTKKPSIAEETTENLPVNITKKKSNRKKKGKTNFITVEDILPADQNESVNKSNMSIDSFHSAAGSPLKDDNDINYNQPEDIKIKEEIILPSEKTGKRKRKLTLEKELKVKTVKEKTTNGNLIDNVNDEATQVADINNTSVKKSTLLASNHFESSKSHTNTKHTDFNNEDSIKELNTTFEAPNKLSGSSSKKRKSIISTEQTDMIETNLNGSFGRKSLNELNQCQQKLSMSCDRNSSASKRKRTYSIEKLPCFANKSAINLDATFEKEQMNQSTNHTTLLEINNIDSGNELNVTKQEKSSSKKKPKISTHHTNLIATNLVPTYDKEYTNEPDQTDQNIETSGANISSPKNKKSSIKNSSYDKIDNTSIINLDATYEKEKVDQSVNNSISIGASKTSGKLSRHSSGKFSSLNSTYDKVSITALNSTFDKQDKLNRTIDQNKPIDSTFDKSQRKSSLTTSDTTNSSEITEDNSCVSITSDESKENIINTTPVLIESSLDESRINVSIRKKTPLKREETFTSDSPAKVTPLKREGTYTEINPQTPQGDGTAEKTPKREGTFSKDTVNSTTPLKRDGTYTEIKAQTPQKTPKQDKNKKDRTDKKTPLKREDTYTEIKVSSPLKRESTFTKDAISPKVDKMRHKSLPSPGCTPFPSSKSASKEKSRLNITHSIEKRKSSMELLPKATRVMFCSPVNSAGVATLLKGKVIKSNLKGSNKSFVFDESLSELTRTGRKRSFTQSEADQIRSKRKRLTEDQQNSVERLARPRTASASARLQEPGTPSKKTTTPTKTKPSRTKLPNFAALHQKQFDKMESLDECQERKAKRARHLLTPTGSVTIVERISPKETQEQKQSEATKKFETPGYTRFGFKLNLDVNPFSIRNTEIKPKEKPNVLKRQKTLPSLTGNTVLRRNIAKQTIMREKSFSDKRNVDRKETRTVIKGVRTNRRFELQMKMRNILDK